VLRALNELKGRLKMNWDEMVIDAVCALYSLDKAVMALPKKEKAPEQTQTQERPAEAPAEKAKGRCGKKGSHLLAQAMLSDKHSQPQP
jgi:hypothetical protein